MDEAYQVCWRKWSEQFKKEIRLHSASVLDSKCGFSITPNQVKRVDFERIECPKCGEKFRPMAAE